MFEGDKVVFRCGNIGVLVLLFEMMVVVLFNDVFVLEWVFVMGEIVCVLFEFVMINIGIVLFDDGYYEVFCCFICEYGMIFVMDEMHTLCVGFGGCIVVWGFDLDVVVVGKIIGVGILVGAFGFIIELFEWICCLVEFEDIDVGGIGGMLVGNAFLFVVVVMMFIEVFIDVVFECMEVFVVCWIDGV